MCITHAFPSGYTPFPMHIITDNNNGIKNANLCNAYFFCFILSCLSDQINSNTEFVCTLPAYHRQYLL